VLDYREACSLWCVFVFVGMRMEWVCWRGVLGEVVCDVMVVMFVHITNLLMSRLKHVFPLTKSSPPK
jgi:hypothetical protein